MTPVTASRSVLFQRINYFSATVCLNGSVQRAWNSSSVTPVQFPGRATIPLGNNLGQVDYSDCLLPVSQLQETGVQKGVFGA